MTKLPSILLACTILAARAEEPHQVGIEEGTRIVLQRGDYLPRPLDDRTPLIVRLGTVEPAADGGFAYQFHFIGFEPGPHKLADYLMRPDGSPADELGDAVFVVRSILPPDHDGSLTPLVPRPFPAFGGYRGLLVMLAALWILCGAALAWFGRRRKAAAAPVAVVASPSWAERMRPYVEAAAAGTLDAAGQAELERLMTAYWRGRLGLPGRRMAEDLASLRRHPDAGELVRALERWLHRPGGVAPAEIQSLLEPYRHLPDEPARQEAMA